MTSLVAADGARSAYAAQRTREARARVAALEARLQRLATGFGVTDEDLRRAAQAAQAAGRHALDARWHAAAAHRSAAERHRRLAELMAAAGNDVGARHHREAASLDEKGAEADARAAEAATPANAEDLP